MSFFFQNGGTDQARYLISFLHLSLFYLVHNYARCSEESGRIYPVHNPLWFRRHIERERTS